MVLTPFGWRNSQIRSVEGVMSWSPFQRKEAAFISSIHAAKGLERPVVVLAELERRFPDERQRAALERSLYIACGRAQQHLLFLLTEPLPRLLRANRLAETHKISERMAGKVETLTTDHLM